MGWETRQRGTTYYVRKVRQAGRVCSEYIGAGGAAQLIAQLDRIERERQAAQRTAEQQARAQFIEQTHTPAALLDYSQAVAALVVEVLGRLGFYRHRRQWRKRGMAADLSPAAKRARDLYARNELTSDERAELRGILSEQTALVRGFGDMARITWRTYMRTLGQATGHGIQVAAEEHAAQLREGLGYAVSSTLEQLLIEEIVLCYFDYYRVQRTYAAATGDTFTLDVMEQWDAMLDSKQRRYLRAVEALARVRRLLKLPAVQINVNQAGGQQVNVQEAR
jgi:hypothetical protein